MSTASSYHYGGWLPERTAATGGPPVVVRLIGWMVAAGASLTAFGTGGKLSMEHLQRSVQQLHATQAKFEVIEFDALRTPLENLKRIREVLRPAISDLATTFGVSRQSVYNWLNGAPVAEENAARLQDLAQAADVLAHEGMTVNASLLKRKFSNGRTLMQIVQAGGSAEDAALLLIQIHKREAAQRERMNARFANRAKTPASADFDLPPSSDPV